MGTHGPAPKPTAIKRLLGNPGKRPLNDQEPQFPVPDSTPYVPRHLNAEAKREWRRVVGILLQAGLYTEVDRAALAMYCQAWGRWVIAERQIPQTRGEILTSDKGYVYQNPWRYEANKAFEHLRQMEAEFGMTPSSRSRIKVTPKKEDDFLSLLFGGDVGIGGARE